MKNKTPNNPSKYLFDAMLYVLNDPALDRDEFEQRLASDPVLCESVAEAVGLFQDIKSVNGSCAKPMVTVCVSSSTQRTPVAFWQWSISIAASIALIAYIGWQSFVFEGGNHNELANVVNAWSDLQRFDELDHAEDSKLRLIGLESELSAGAEEVSDDEVPDWLILATIATVAVSIGETIQ